MRAGPVNIAVRAIFAMLSPLMPARLVRKIHLMKDPQSQLESVLGGRHLLPTFMGGTYTHDVVDEATGDFDWKRMDVAMWEARRALLQRGRAKNNVIIAKHINKEQ